MASYENFDSSEGPLLNPIEDLFDYEGAEVLATGTLICNGIRYIQVLYKHKTNGEIKFLMNRLADTYEPQRNPHVKL